MQLKTICIAIFLLIYKNYKYSLLIFCFFALIPYHTEAQESYKIDVAKGKNISGNHYLSSIAKSVEYIPLEAKAGTYIKQVENWDMGDDLIIVVTERGERIMQFDGAGRFVRDFLKRGQGPNEFISIYSLDINIDNEVLISKAYHTIEIYSDDQILKHRFSSPAPAGEAKWISKNRIAVIYDYPHNLLNDGYHVNIYSREGELLGRFINRADQGDTRSPAHFYNNTSVIEDHLNYYDNWSDTVFQIGPDLEVKPYVILLKDKNAIDHKILKYGNMHNYLAKGKNYYVQRVYETHNNIILHGPNGNRPMWLIFSKASGTIFNTMQKNNSIDFGYTNDLDRGPAFRPVRLIGDNISAVIMTPRNLSGGASYYDRNPKKYDPEMVDLDLLNRLVEYGNPVIMKVRMK